MINSQTYKRNQSYDIILELKPIDGTKPKNSIGLIDPRLFTGENKLHAIMDKQTCLWHLKYDDGLLPVPLKQRFTGMAPLLKYVKNYFATRNIEIIEVKD